MTNARTTPFLPRKSDSLTSPAAVDGRTTSGATSPAFRFGRGGGGCCAARHETQQTRSRGQTRIRPRVAPRRSGGKATLVIVRLLVYQIDAFTGRLFAGNPAAVCPLDEWLDASI